MTQRRRPEKVDKRYMQVNGYHINFPSQDPSEEWRDCVTAVDVAALERASETNELKEATSD
eukprot:COSAG01_NODE_2378_length_7796_cov_5.017020_9_plen_61_part_00